MLGKEHELAPEKVARGIEWGIGLVEGGQHEDYFSRKIEMLGDGIYFIEVFIRKADLSGVKIPEQISTQAENVLKNAKPYRANLLRQSL